MHDVVVIGGGVSGLACAHDLLEQGLDVQLLERQHRIGGNAQSRAFDGYLMELGPTTLNAAFPEVRARIARLGLADSAVPLGAGVRKRYLLDRDRGRLAGISTHPLGFFLSSYLSVPARILLAAEILRPPRPADAPEETVHQFVSRRFGREFANKVIDPMAAGIFMGDARVLSVAGAFDRLAAMERRHGSVIRAILASRRGGDPGRKLFSWPGGVATLPRALAERLGGRIATGVAVRSIARAEGRGGGFDVRTVRHGDLRARAVVLAVQPHVAAALCETLDPDTASAAGDIAAPPVAVVFLGYRRASVGHALDGLGYLTTRAGPDLVCGTGHVSGRDMGRDTGRNGGLFTNGAAISGTQFVSTMFPGRAPRGHVAIACYVGGARKPDLALAPEEQLVAAVHDELAATLSIRATPSVARLHRWPRGLPQYSLGHVARRQLLEDSFRRVPGLFLAGNYLDGVSLNCCLARARTVADQVARHMFGAGRDGAGRGQAGHDGAGLAQGGQSAAPGNGLA